MIRIILMVVFLRVGFSDAAWWLRYPLGILGCILAIQLILAVLLMVWARLEMRNEE